MDRLSPMDIRAPSSRRSRLWLAVLATTASAIGAIWLAFTAGSIAPVSLPPVAAETLASGVIASMDSPAFAYSPGWTVSAAGADPHEPLDPWLEPSGVVEFSYRGRELALRLALGDFWGYLYVTVDGRPANLLPVIRGNVDSQGQPAGYRTFYVPELQTTADPSPVWVRVHRAAQSDPPHQVRVEVWRSWGQTPLRGVAVDALPPAPWPRWPGVALLVLGAWGLAWATRGWLHRLWARRAGTLRSQVDAWIASDRFIIVTGGGLALLAVGVAWNRWWLCLAGLAALGLAALFRPAIWVAALLFGLPFYFRFPLPVLPIRSFSLVDVGVFGGLALLVLHFLLLGRPKATHVDRACSGFGSPASLGLLLAAMVSWALIAAFAAHRLDVALREWRTVFLTAGAFGLLLAGVLQTARQPEADLRLLVAAWLAGATVVALVALGQYVSGTMLVTAEGVHRVRAFYGSPNNLALYLERTLAVTLALALFSHGLRARLLWGLAAACQAAALLLTFSKGGIFLAAPAMLVMLWLGGMGLLGQRGEPRRVLWWLAGAAAIAALALVPFLSAERFRNLLDFGQGTGFLRVQLWRSAWRMALDHPLWGVGPDNFLYAYRSEYLLPTAWQEPNLNHPHNWLLDWWTRLGLLGLAVGVLFWSAGVAGLMRTLSSAGKDAQRSALVLGALAATAAALAHGTIDVSYALPDLMIVWVALFLLPIKAR